MTKYFHFTGENNFLFRSLTNSNNIKRNMEDLEEVEDKANQNMMAITENASDIRNTCQQVAIPKGNIGC